MSAPQADAAPGHRCGTPRTPGIHEDATGGRLATGRLTRRAALTLAPAMALAAACTSKSNAPAASTKGVDRVTYQTGFGTFGREAYVYVAKAKGYFTDAGIDVQIIPGTGQPADMQGVAANKTQFLTGETTAALTAISKGLKDFKLIGAVHQRTVIALMALGGNGMTRPQDLQGKTVGYGGASPHDMFPAYARLAGFDPASVKWVPLPPPTLPAALAAKRVDAIGQFVTGTPLVRAAAKGADIVVFPYGDVLSDLYGNVLTTNTQMIQTKPDLVRRFTDALFKGLAYTINNPEESGKIMNQSVSTTPAAIATAEIQTMKPYVTSNGSIVGTIDQSRMSRAIALLASVGVVAQGSLTPESVVDFDYVPKA
jgi:NitT/TauT family transport system substrate-binding protein